MSCLGQLLALRLASFVGGQLHVVCLAYVGCPSVGVHQAVIVYAVLLVVIEAHAALQEVFGENGFRLALNRHGARHIVGAALQQPVGGYLSGAVAAERLCPVGFEVAGTAVACVGAVVDGAMHGVAFVGDDVARFGVYLRRG